MMRDIKSLKDGDRFIYQGHTMKRIHYSVDWIAYECEVETKPPEGKLFRNVLIDIDQPVDPITE